MKLLLRFFKGTLRIKASCPSSSYYCGLLMKKYASKVFDFKTMNDTFEFICYYRAYKKILKDIDFEKVEFTVMEGFGIVRILQYIHLRPGIALGIILGMILCYIQAVPIWEIRVTGNRQLSEEEIIKVLENVGFSIGWHKNNDELDYIINNVLINDHRLSRISINLSGNIAFVEVGERSEIKERSVPSSMTGLYASRDSRVVLPKVESGGNLVSVGDIVEKGQMLVSPVIQGDNENQYLVGARGVILGETRDTFLVAIPYINTYPSDLGEWKNIYTADFLGKSLAIDFANTKCKNILYRSHKEKLKFFNRFDFPINIYTYVGSTYSPKIIETSKEDARRRAYEKIYKRISNVKSKAEILGTEFCEQEFDEYFLLVCYVDCIENIATEAF